MSPFVSIRYPSGYEVGAEYPDAGYWMNSCEGVKKHHDSKVEEKNIGSKMDDISFKNIKIGVKESKIVFPTKKTSAILILNWLGGKNGQC